MQKRIERDKGVRMGEAGKFDALIGEKLLHYGRFPRSHHNRHIDLSRQELFAGRSRRQGEPFADLPLHPGALGQLERQRSRPAPFRPNRDLLAAQSLDPYASDLALMEPPQWLVIDS